MAKRKPYWVKIRWGSHPEEDSPACTYEFNTHEELSAFLTGVDEAGGWLDYEIVKRSARR